MMASSVRAEIVAEKIAYIRNMIEAIRTLPLSSYDDFSADARNAAAAESYLRRALAALFDLGRHILVKAFATAPAEYKQIAGGLTQKGVLSRENGRILREMAGYRNRMVHFYHEIGEQELYNICRDRLADIGPDERRISVRSIRVDGPRFADHQPSAHPAQWHDAKRRAIERISDTLGRWLREHPEKVTGL